MDIFSGRDWTGLIEKYLKAEKKDADEVLCFCPFHQDKKTPNLYVNIKKGVYHCFACSASGNIFQLIGKLENCDFQHAKKVIFAHFGIGLEEDVYIDPVLVEEYHRNLLKASDVLDWVIKNRGILLETIIRYKIGWDGNRNTIPIFDEHGNVVNIRLYHAKKRFKMISYSTKERGFGKTRLYGLDELLNRTGDQVILCEGEWDKLLLSQNGFLAVTNTTGAGTFKTDWLDYFKGREVIIIYDFDSEGKKGADKVSRLLFGVASSVKVIDLPLKGTKESKDITDFFKLGHTKADLMKLIDETRPYERQVEEPVESIKLDSFSYIDNKDYIDKRIEADLSVCGETSEAFHAVRKFKVSYCDWFNSGNCSICDHIWELREDEKEYIESCMSTDEQIMGMLRRKICPFNRKPRIEILEKVTVREFFASQRIERCLSSLDGKSLLDEKAREIVERKVYYLSDLPVKPQGYTVTGFVKTHPKTQQVTLLATKIVPLEEEFESFELNPGTQNQLDKLSRIPVKDLIYYLSSRVLKLTKRDDLIFAILLTYFSPLRILFNKDLLRGWINLAVIGDTDTGKTAAVQRFSEFVGIGDIVSGLSASRTGITYGLKEHKQKGWQIKIGRYPANTRKIVTLDELQFLSSHDIRTLGKAMDEGFVTVDRIAEKTFESMTRLIVLCNPKKDRVMEEHMFGCEAMKEIFDKAIIRRFDLGIFTSHSDIEHFKELNIDYSGFDDLPFDSREMRTAIFWAWTRDKDQIFFAERAKELILVEATRLSEIFGYAFDVPLVAPGDFRNKLARLSAALATLSISTDDFENVRVKEEHVREISDYIVRIYSNINVELKDYSETYKIKTQLDDYDEIKKSFLDIIEKEKFKLQGKFECLLYLFKINDNIKKIDLAEQAGVSDKYVQRKANFLRSFNLIDSTPNGYIKKPKFNKLFHLLSRELKAKPVIGPETLKSARLLTENED